MSNCPSFVASPILQLQPGAGPTGPVDCQASAMAVAIAAATCGAKRPTGRQIRLLSSEPVPDPRSPGLNLAQVAAVALEHFGVYFEVHVGQYSLPFAEYEKRRLAGRPTIIDIGYEPVAQSEYDAGRGFGRNGGGANHAFAEIVKTTYDSLADGRGPGVWRWDGSLYRRRVIADAASRLDIGNHNHPHPGTVWAAFGPDVTATLPPVPYGPDVPAAIRKLDPPGRSAAVWIMRTGHAFGSVIDAGDFEAALRRAKLPTALTVKNVLRLRDWRP